MLEYFNKELFETLSLPWQTVQLRPVCGRSCRTQRDVVKHNRKSEQDIKKSSSEKRPYVNSLFHVMRKRNW